MGTPYTPDLPARLRTLIFNGSIPLRIQLSPSDSTTYDSTQPYLIQFPRLSYLALLATRLHAFFTPSLIHPDVAPSALWLSFQGVPLRWHFPLGLLYDLYAGADPTSTDDSESPSPLPWTLTAHFTAYPAELVPLDAAVGGDNKVLHDMFRNAVKEADYLRNGTAKTVMFLSERDSTQLWDGVRLHDAGLFEPVNAKLLKPQGAELRNLPLRLYLPHAARAEDGAEGDESVAEAAQSQGKQASLRVVQGLVPMRVGNRLQTLGMALNALIPSLFPSRRSPLLAHAVLHGAVVPLGVDVDELLRTAAYLDGWLHVVIVMMG